MAFEQEKDYRGLTALQAAFVDAYAGSVVEAARLRRPTEDLWKALQTQAGAYLTTFGFAIAMGAFPLIESASSSYRLSGCGSR